MVGRHGQAIPEDERVHYSDGVSCWASKTVVDGPFTGRSSVCGCDALVVQGQSAWHFDYSRTGPMLSAKYWAEQANRNNAHFPPDFPMATVMHIRLGDVEFHPGPGKFVDGQTLATMVGAFVSASKMNPSCLNVTLVTDGKRDNEHVLAVQAAWSDSGVQSIHVSDIDEPVDKAFDDMTHASILLGGPSGFPRLAAVLGRAQVKVFLNGKDESHPIWYLDGATELPLESGRTEMQDHIMSNSALMNAAFACEEWLRR